MTHFAAAWVASNSKQMGPSHSMKMGNLSGENMVHILTQLPPASVFTNSAENSGLLTVICEGVFFFPLSSSVDVTSSSDRDLCSVFKEESLSQQQEEQGDTSSPRTTRVVSWSIKPQFSLSFWLWKKKETYPLSHIFSLLQSKEHLISLSVMLRWLIIILKKISVETGAAFLSRPSYHRAACLVHPSWTTSAINLAWLNLCLLSIWWE